MAGSQIAASKSRVATAASSLVGTFIAIEGTDGSGKSTIANRLAQAFREAGREVVLTREPGGTPIGEEIRSVLFGPAAPGMVAETEMLLFAAARAQHVAEAIQPALARGAIVVSDRFADSSIAYQAGGRQLPMAQVVAVQRIATGGLEPDLKILLDLPVALGLQRRFAVGDGENRLDRETMAFHSRVHAAYNAMVVADPERWCVIDAVRDVDAVWADVWKAVTAKNPSGSEQRGDAQYAEDLAST